MAPWSSEFLQLRRDYDDLLHRHEELLRRHPEDVDPSAHREQWVGDRRPSRHDCGYHRPMLLINRSRMLLGMGSSFLGGTLESVCSLRPNHLLKYEIIRSLRDQGLIHLVLGGGPRPRDGIFRYKRSFARRGVVDFKIGEHVHDPVAYEALVQQPSLRAAAGGKSWKPAPEFFPAYRAG